MLFIFYLYIFIFFYFFLLFSHSHKKKINFLKKRNKWVWPMSAIVKNKNNFKKWVWPMSAIVKNNLLSFYSFFLWHTWATIVVQTKAHFFRFLEVNILLRIEQDNICYFEVLMQLHSALLPLSAPYNFLHSRCLYKVSSFTWHVDVDRNR